MKENNCSFDRANNRFRYRAAAIIIEDGCILFASNEKNDYFYSIGGAVHIGETSQDAVIREVFEETGVQYEIERLLFVHENFFSENGIDWHEISFYYLMKPRGTKKLNSHSFTMGVEEKMNWLPIDKLCDYKHFPSFIYEKLPNLPDYIEHIVTFEK